ncbi:alpha/beta hydrolase-fold protein [Aestuariimicrobium soli]|uniref:alpha/beta hydrolase-fold protein n=1 Tax=Aestuariimicrobium soli TaxID=2035834 RepID=UPI003EC0AFCC
MWELTGGLLAGTVATLAVLVPVAAAVFVRRRWQAWLAALLAQLLAVSAVFLLVNRHYEFFATWDDLVGVPGQVGRLTQVKERGAKAVPVQKIAISSDNPHPLGEVVTMPVPDSSPAYATASVYLPAAYFEPGQRAHRFPVVVMVAGLGMPGPKFAHLLDAVTQNSTVIDEGRASPFVAVYVGGSIVTGIDSECVDVPGAPQQTFLGADLPSAIAQHYRVTADHTRWFIAGWSTGGYCAALMTATHPRVYAAGAALAGYYHPIFDDQHLLDTPAAPDRTAAVTAENDLVRMVTTRQLIHLRLLNVMSTADDQSWGTVTGPPDGPDGRRFHQAARSLPGVAFQLVKGGGHRFGTYLPLYDPSLAWLGTAGL